jgi:hypothetical protein
VLHALSQNVILGHHELHANLLSRLELHAQQVACRGSTLQAASRAQNDTGKGNQGDDDNKGLTGRVTQGVSTLVTEAVPGSPAPSSRGATLGIASLRATWAGGGIFFQPTDSHRGIWFFIAPLRAAGYARTLDTPRGDNVPFIPIREHSTRGGGIVAKAGVG